MFSIQMSYKCFLNLNFSNSFRHIKKELKKSTNKDPAKELNQT